MIGRALITFAAGALSISMGFAQAVDAIADVIDKQLGAFTARDLDEAWRYASPNIQGLFGDAENFGMMVERGYPMVWNNAEVHFMEQREIAGSLWQKVMIRDSAGGLHLLDYQMIQTEDGWRIDAVQLLPAPDVGV